MDYQSIRFEVAESVATLTLARPDKLNAMTPGMADEMRHALAHTADARAVLIRGEGRAFCSGADLSAIVAHGDPGEGAYDSLTGHFHPLLEAIVEHELPVVAQVQGAAAGIGCSLALACDFCIASEDAYFLQAFVNIALVPDGGASWLLPRLIGRARAAEMLMLGERIRAPQAQEWGLIHRWVTPEELDEEARALAMRLAQGPTRALGLMKRNLDHALDHSLGSTLQMEAEAQREAAGSDDAKEGIGAFLTKRVPEFKGK
ncbi:MAG TPA: enoyl-CoA hydratase-related protein [Sphingomonadaceae bacterium]|nr:enoyl-CoA hydratase-related protein [Sphingomonadaceae bacterium]